MRGRHDVLRCVILRMVLRSFALGYLCYVNLSNHSLLFRGFPFLEHHGEMRSADDACGKHDNQRARQEQQKTQTQSKSCNSAFVSPHKFDSIPYLRATYRQWIITKIPSCSKRRDDELQRRRDHCRRWKNNSNGHQRHEKWQREYERHDARLQGAKNVLHERRRGPIGSSKVLGYAPDDSFEHWTR